MRSPVGGPGAAGPDGGIGTTAPPTVGPYGRYALGTLLGRGGMADVYQARDQTLGRDVAVKLLRERTPDPSDRARFVTEAQTLARLNHPNLVTILDAGFSDEHPFLVLELVVGSSLAATLTQTGRGLPPQRVATIGAQIAAALAHCHAAGVVHRDVKPGNILLGVGDRALLTDFGVSRLLDGSTHHTKTGSTIGTASYLAPEQVYGDVLTPAVDMYALGLVLLEACTAQREYAGTPVEAAIARLHRSPRLPPALPSPLAEVLAALTQTDPALRPGAGEIAQRLTPGSSPEWLDGSISNVTADGSRASAIARRRTPDVAAATGPLDVSTGTRRPDATQASERRPPPGVAAIGWALAAAAAVALAITLLAMPSRPSRPSHPKTDSVSAAQRSTTASRTPTPRANTRVERAPAQATPRRTTGAASRPGASNRHSTARHQAKQHAPASARGRTNKPPKAHGSGKGKGKGHHGGKGK